MSAEAELFAVGRRHHDALLTLLQDLEAVARAHGGTPMPGEAARLQAAVWPFLQAYGRRDHRGVVDEDIAPPLEAWRPEPGSEALVEVDELGAHPQQVGVVDAERDRDGDQPVARKTHLGRGPQVEARDGVSHGEAWLSGAGGAVEVRDQGHAHQDATGRGHQ